MLNVQCLVKIACSPFAERSFCKYLQIKKLLVAILEDCHDLLDCQGVLNAELKKENKQGRAESEVLWDLLLFSCCKVR